ncbi:MAG: glycyl-tRNA synthetase beta chain [Halanaerobium sp. 4-GBenrich]|jgi:glycyl-tRNA synthetase beta chain|uniref:Glycine--tRNA ligase beta subunit n=2 Tax=Halanaerobium congolense TaxID=54121 RepID=A0A1H9YAR0_9FIRM|nr:MAG: glycyl-tRNA synthetase beta chain [Halanaerobium sp. 4-GBenrich]PTX16795.1 glycyl-tRNA synthetase beta chain [Halanaerobium congolense]SDE79581.1 glycyl-tRNA synthetase beta chain [Halanaerobium congolense]SES65954.1 glycyl-tRNA synthetase beta chain [Halanaerobium congolense]SFO88362.1 glycyl-tRNA synthetase beta chain [Halanaerobium congolense]
MMAKNLIFEIGTEEMPAASMQRFRKDYLKTAEAVFDNNNLEYQMMNVYSTPRRLVLAVDSLAEKQDDNKEIVRGPAVNIAFDDDGQPTKAGEGFARGQGVDVSDLVKKDGYLYAEKIEKGKPTSDILADVLKKIVDQVPLPKAMRWGSVKMEFIRPIKWLLLLFGEEELDLEIAGVESSNYSIGHRFLSDGKIKVNAAEAYLDSLEEAAIIVKQEKRKELIKDQISKLDLAGEAVIKDSLLAEVIDLIEFPTAFKGSFSEEYLELPAEVLITAMEKHQRYFPVMSSDNTLEAEFIGVRDGGTDYLDEVISGNEMVLKGRLDDAQFFFAEDQKYGFLNRTEDIKDIVFQKDIGSVYQKVQKLQKITAEIAEILDFDSARKKMAVRAAELCKNDLATEMVNEFANLQGLMGKEYALLEGEAEETAQAIFEHYLPRFAGDKLPETKSGTALALAEKLFNLSSHFLLGNIPSGSQDPFALRRQATGLLRIVLDNKLKINIEQVIKSTMEIVEINLKNLDTAVFELKEFIKQRLENLLAEESVRYDIINAVINVNDQNLLDVYQRAHKLMEFRSDNSDLFVDLIRGLVRAKNISDKAENKLEVEAGLLVEDEEKELYEAVNQRAGKIKEFFASGQYQQGFYLLVELKEFVDAFLDSVMVMVDDQKLKNNRLALLSWIAGLMVEVMDIEEIALD